MPSPGTDLPEVLEIATPDCVAEEFAGEIVVLNVASGVYFSLSDLAAAVWRDLAAGHATDSLLAGISRVNEESAGGVARFIASVEQAGLMRRTNSPPLRSDEPESIALVRNGKTMLSFQSFEDMKDLILADPIHDVDGELGWPALRRDEP